MATVERFEDLDVWQNARTLANLVYALSAEGAFARDFALKSQMRRAAVSVMSNIAEGFESRTQALFIDFLGRAKGSAGEVRAQLYLALDQLYLSQAEFDETCRLVSLCSRQLSNLIRYLESQPKRTRLRELPETYETQP